MKTSLYSLLCLVIRLGAVLWAFHTVETIFWVLVALNADGTASLPALALGMTALLLAGALWLWPGMLARLAAGRSAYQVFEVSLSVETLQRVSYAVLGAWWVLRALGGIADNLVQIAMLKRSVSGVGSVDLHAQWGLLTFYVVTGVAGAVLLMGHRRLVSWLRYAGSPQPAVVEQSPE